MQDRIDNPVVEQVLLGAFSTHWREPHRLSEAKRRMLDVLARQAADLLERRRGESALRDSEARERAARTEAEQASQLKDEFLATLSHELRTPLNAIIGWSQLIDKNPRDAAAVNEGIKVITRNARMQADLIADLLDMSRIVSGKLRLEVEDLNLAEIITGAIDAVRHSAAAKGIRIEPVLSPI